MSSSWPFVFLAAAVFLHNWRVRFWMRTRLAVFGLGAVAVVLAVETPDIERRTITWADVAPVHAQLTARGESAQSFEARVAQIRERTAQRVREGDLDHLIFYLLQSTRFTKLPAIEPALSARAYVDTGRIPDNVRPRTDAFLAAVSSSSADPRLAFFHDLVETTFRDRTRRTEAILREYERVMRFVYEKEFVAQRSERAVDAIAELYRKRGLSTDTAVEAGYLVYQGLGIVKSNSPERPINRVLIVGPGLDLAPRTGLLEAGPPESYQPWAVMDAVLALGLSKPGDLEIYAADINPRVVEHLRRAVLKPPVLTLVSGIEESVTVRCTEGYREYFAQLGRAIGAVEDAQTPGGSLRKRVSVRPGAVRALRPVRLDIVTERMAGLPTPHVPGRVGWPAGFDLVIATNILPYFDDLELTLALSNIAAMLAPGGVFLHNEPRLSLGDITTAVGLPFNQLRQATIATVRNGPPLADSVFIHRRSR